MRLLARWFLVFGSSLSVACAAAEPTPAPPPPRPASTKAPAPAVAPARAAQLITFAAEAAPTLRSSQKLLTVADGARLSRKEFDLALVRAASPSAVQASEAGALLLLLDDQSPRPLLAPSVPLRSVVDEDRELSPGWHVLVAYVQTPEAVELEVVHFELELDRPAPRAEAACALLEPGGTVVSPPSGAVRLLAAPLSPRIKQLEYYLDADPSAIWRAPALEAVRALGVPSGDHRVGVRCYDGAGVLVGESERIVTVNRDEELGRQ